MNLSLHHKALFCAKNFKLSEKELVVVLEEIALDKTYLAFGKPSLWRYCVETLGLTESETGRFIGVTRKSIEIPEFKEAIRTGNLSVGKAARITSVITQFNSDSWIELAKESTHREIEREIAKENPKPLIKERIKALNATHSELRLSISIDLENKLKKACELSKSKNMEETLLKLTDFYLKHKDKVQKAERLEACSSKPEQSLRVEKKTTSAAHVQSKKRTIPQAIQHQVNLRDRGQCQFKDCRETKYVQIHHQKPFSQGGTHDLSNLITLCSAHHSLLHGGHTRGQEPVRYKPQVFA